MRLRSVPLPYTALEREMRAEEYRRGGDGFELVCFHCTSLPELHAAHLPLRGARSACRAYYCIIEYVNTSFDFRHTFINCVTRTAWDQGVKTY